MRGGKPPGIKKTTRSRLFECYPSFPRAPMHADAKARSLASRLACPARSGGEHDGRVAPRRVDHPLLPGRSGAVLQAEQLAGGRRCGRVAHGGRGRRRCGRGRGRGWCRGLGWRRRGWWRRRFGRRRGRGGRGGGERVVQIPLWHVTHRHTQTKDRQHSSTTPTASRAARRQAAQEHNVNREQSRTKAGCAGATLPWPFPQSVAAGQGAGAGVVGYLAVVCLARDYRDSVVEEAYG